MEKKILWVLLVSMVVVFDTYPVCLIPGEEEREKHLYYLEGKITDQQGESLAGFMIEAIEGIPATGKVVGGCFTNESGYYSIALPVGLEKISIRCAFPGNNSKATFVKEFVLSKSDWEKHEHLMVLPDIKIQVQDFVDQGMLVRGRLLDAETGKPLGGVELFLKGIETLRTNTLGNYLFLLNEPPAKTTVLQLTKGEWKYDTLIVAKRGEVITLTDLCMTQEQVLAIPNTQCVIRGKCVDTRGKSIPQVLVTLRPGGAGCLTKKNGKFALVKILKTKESATLEFSKEGYYKRNETIQLVGGKMMDLDTIVLNVK